jgi:hypothetical protein
MTSHGRYSRPRPTPPRREHPQLRIVGTREEIDAIRELLASAVETAPGWEIVRTSKPRPRREEPGRHTVHLILAVNATPRST